MGGWVGVRGFDLATYYPPPGPFLLLASGSITAGIFSSWIRPEAPRQIRHKLWDPIWFGIHEAIALPLWFIFGWAMPGKAMRRYLAARAGFTVIGISWGGWSLFIFLQTVFWICLVCYGVSKLTQRIAMSHHNRVRKAEQ